MGEPVVPVVDDGELTDEQADAAFESGFGEETPTETPAPSTPEPQTQAVEKPVQQPPPPQIEYVQLPKSDYETFRQNATKVQEISAALEKLSGTAFGKIGGLERTLKQMQDATPQGQSVSLTDEDFKELLEEYPEFGAMTRKTMERIFSRLKGTGAPAFDEEKVGSVFQSRFQTEREKIRQELTEEYATKFMDWNHKGWRQTVNSPEYQAWMGTQPQDYQKKIAESWDPSEITDSIDQFKAHQEKTKPTPPLPPRDKPTGRFRAALVPKGAGGQQTAESEDDEFERGYKEASGH